MKRRFSRRARSFGRSFKRGASKYGGVGKSANLIQLDAMLYGAVRGPVSAKVAEILPIPVIGTVGDEVVMGLIDYLVAKNTSGMVRDVALKGLVVENAMLGAGVSQMVLGGTTVSSSTSLWNQ